MQYRLLFRSRCRALRPVLPLRRSRRGFPRPEVPPPVPGLPAAPVACLSRIREKESRRRTLKGISNKEKLQAGQMSDKLHFPYICRPCLLGGTSPKSPKLARLILRIREREGEGESARYSLSIPLSTSRPLSSLLSSSRSIASLKASNRSSTSVRRSAIFISTLSRLFAVI